MLPWTDFVWTYLRYLQLHGITFDGQLSVTQPTLGDPVTITASTATTGSNPTETTYQNKVLTTDATATQVHAVVIPASTTVGFHGYVTGRRTGGSSGTAEDGAYYRVEFVAKNVVGVATIIGNTINAIGESQAGWDCTLSPSVGSIKILVTGAANNNVSWAFTGITNPVSA